MMHSGYPFMAHLVSVVRPLIWSTWSPRAAGTTSRPHHQWNPSRLSGTTETTCTRERLLDGGPRRPGPGPLGYPATKAPTHGVVLPRRGGHDDWSVWTALDTYLIIKEEWGWAPITQALTAYYTLPTSEVPSTDQEEFNAWVLHISSASGYNPASPSRCWGFPYPTHSQLLQYPAWVDDPVRDYLAFDPIIRNLSAGSTTGSSTQVDWQVYDNGMMSPSLVLRPKRPWKCRGGLASADRPMEGFRRGLEPWVSDWIRQRPTMRLRATTRMRTWLIPLLGQPRTEGPDHALGL